MKPEWTHILENEAAFYYSRALYIFSKDIKPFFMCRTTAEFEIVCLSYAFLFFFFFLKFKDWKKEETTESEFCTGFRSYWLPTAWHMKYL